MARAVQLFVLIALMAVQSVAVTVTLEYVTRHHLHRRARTPRRPARDA